MDFLTKKQRVNTGQVPQYYVEDNHEAIISDEQFEMVQAEIERRTGKGKRYSGVSIFSNKLKCGDCGGWYGLKVWHSTDQYRKVIYQCNHKFKKGEKNCTTPHLTEDQIKEAFVKAMNRLIAGKEKVIADSEFARQFLTDTADLEKEQTELEQEIAVLVEMTQNTVAENARVALDQKEYQERYNGLVDRYDRAKARYEEVTDAIAAKKTRYKALGTFIDRLREQDVVTKFDAGLWGSMVKFMTVYSDNDIRVTFQNDVEVKAE